MLTWISINHNVDMDAQGALNKMTGPPAPMKTLVVLHLDSNDLQDFPEQY
jgi:hypothetical protein